MFQSEVEDTNPVINYVCPNCDAHFSSLDFTTILDRKTGLMICEECQTELKEDVGSNGSEDRSKKRRVSNSLKGIVIVNADHERNVDQNGNRNETDS